MNNILSSYISASDITMYSNIVFFVIIGLIAMGFLIGIIKGVWKKTFSLICTLGLSLTLIFCVKPLSNFIYNYDISSIIKNFNITVPDGSGDFKSFGELLHNLINHYLESGEVQIEMTPDMIQLVDGLAHSIIQLTLFIVGVILIIIILSLICPLLYHLLFKWIIPKNTRKHHKVRFLGGLEGLIEITCILSLVLMPFTGIANSILSGVRDENGNIQVNKDNDNELYQLVCDILNGYNESILANSLFKITLNGKPIDVSLMNYITESDLNDTTKLKLFDEIKILSSLAFDALSKGVVDLTAQTVNLSIILQSEFITDSLHKLAESSLICSTLPIALLIGLNYSGNMIDVDFSNVDLSNIDWKDSLNGIGDAFLEIQQSGIISDEIIESPNLLMDKIMLNREHETELKNALNILFNSSIVDELMPQIAVSILESRRETPKSEVSVKRSQSGETQDNENRFLNFSADLPDEAYDVDTYKSIDWGKELSDMLEIVLRVAEQFTLVYGEEVSLSKVVNLFDQKVLMNSLFGINDKIIYETEKDYENNIYLNGGEINESYIYGTKKIIGSTKEENNIGLLDLQFFKKLLVDFNIIPEIIPNIVHSLEGKEQIGDINEACDRLANEISKWNINDWKDEFNALLEASVPLINATKFINSENGLQTLKDFSFGEGNFALVYFSEKIESSFLLNDVAPLLFKAYTTNPTNDMALALGLRLSDLNFTDFDESSFAKELKSIARDVLPNSQSIINLVEEKNVNIKKIIHEREGLEESLEAIYLNQITNPHLTDEEIRKNELTNFENVMINLLCNPTAEDIANGVDTSLNVPTITNNLVCVEKNTILKIGRDENRNWFEEDGKGEIHYLFDTLESLEAKEPKDTEYILEYISGDGSINIEEKVYEMGNEVKRIFATVDNSLLMKDAFPFTLNKILKDNEVGKFADFNNVDNWEKEGACFADTLDKINELKKSNQSSDIVTILKDCDKDLLREYQFLNEDHQKEYNLYDGKYYLYFEENSNSYKLLNSLYNTQSIDLPTVLYDTVKNILTSTEDENQQIISDQNIQNAESDFKFDSDSIKYDDNLLYVNWVKKEEKESEYRGEIYNMARLFIYSNSLNNIDSIENEEEFDEILNIANLSYPLRNIIGDIIKNSLEKVSDNSNEMIQSIISEDHADYDAFERIKFNYLENDDITNRLAEIKNRKIEIDAICALYSKKGDFENINEDNFNSEVSKLTENGPDGSDSKLVDLLNKLHQSELFNSSAFIASTENGKRNMITSFENTFNAIFNMKDDIFEQVPETKIYSLNNRKGNDKWVGKEGEIVNFNNAINESINSTLYKEIISKSEDDTLETIKGLYKGDSPKYMKELSVSLKKSIMMEYQLPKIYDNYIYSELKDNMENLKDQCDIDHDYILADTPYRSLYNKENLIIDWSDEGDAIDQLFEIIAKSNINFDDPSNIKSEDIDSFFNAVSVSNVLKYDRSKYCLVDNAFERNFYEYDVCAFDSYIKNKIFDENIFEIDNKDEVKNYTDTLDIESYNDDRKYENEKDCIVKFIECYEQLKGDRPYNDSGDSKKFLEDGKNMELSNLTANEVDGFADILNNMMKNALYKSKVFNFRTFPDGKTEYYVKGDNYLNRCVYEYSIIYLSNKIRDALVENYGFSVDKGYDIDKETSNKLDSLMQFSDEQTALINIVRSYGPFLEALNGSDNGLSIKFVANNVEYIENIYESVKLSKILNHTIGDKTSKTLSIYDDMVLYLIDKINSNVYSSSIISDEDKKENYISISDIKNNSILESQENYDNEVNLILGKGGIIYIINEMNLENDNEFTFNIDYVNNNKDHLISLLKCFEKSYSFNYTRSGYHGRTIGIKENTTSTFEDICIEIFNQDSFNEKIYDDENMMQKSILNNLIYDDSKISEKAKAKALVKYKIMRINDQKSNDSYIDDIKFFKDNSVDENDNGEIDKLFALFDKISKNTALEFSNIDDSKEILIDISQIYILHDIVPKLIREISLDQGIKDNNSDPNSIGSLKDVTEYRHPEFYFYEYKIENNEDGSICYKFDDFATCANSYDAEISAINKMLDSAKNANISGEIKNINPGQNIFESLLEDINKSNIFRNIYSELVTRILSQIKYQVYSLDRFILCNNKTDFENDNTHEEWIVEEINAIEDNFKKYYEDEGLYGLEGASLDSFVDHIIYISKGEDKPIKDSKYIGGTMIKNFDSFLESLVF